MSLVLDSSATLAWIFGDETTEAIRQVFEDVAEYGAVVPSLWRLEVANTLTIAVRRGRIEAAFRNAALVDLALLDITTDQQTDNQAWQDTLSLADRFGLTSYDAAYLELAQRRNLPLATLDRHCVSRPSKPAPGLWGSTTARGQFQTTTRFSHAILGRYPLVSKR